MGVNLTADELTFASTESVYLLDGGEQAYPRMHLAIERARRYVHLEVYVFAPLGVGVCFIEALCRASKRGVVTTNNVLAIWLSARSSSVIEGVGYCISPFCRALLDTRDRSFTSDFGPDSILTLVCLVGLTGMFIAFSSFVNGRVRFARTKSKKGFKMNKQKERE